MFAEDIVTATKKLQLFGLRSKIYAYFLACSSTLAIIVSAVLDGATTLSMILAGLCTLLIPSAIYFSSAIVDKITARILTCSISSVEEFDTSFKGPFSGMSWAIFTITFFLACGEILFTYYVNQAFGTYSLFIVAFTVVWMARFYSYFHELKTSVNGLRDRMGELDAGKFPACTKVLIEEAQRGNTETIMDKRDDLTSL